VNATAPVTCLLARWKIDAFGDLRRRRGGALVAGRLPFCYGQAFVAYELRNGVKGPVNVFKLRGARPAPRLVGDHRLYVVGDIHGRADLLDAVLSRIDVDIAADPCGTHTFMGIGDYVDRGPHSREVLDRLVECVQSRKTVLLKGNHEIYLLEFLRNPSVLRDWRHFGGLQTLFSYGLRPSLDPSEAEAQELSREFASVLPWEHRALLQALPNSLSLTDFFFAHAGIKPGVPFAEQDEQDLLWIRDEFLLCEDDFGRVIIHGHTPVREPEIHPNRINIDTGAYATGRLTCLKIQGETIEML
jgi:serine/threonine protein phosphatase 1